MSVTNEEPLFDERLTHRAIGMAVAVSIGVFVLGNLALFDTSVFTGSIWLELVVLSVMFSSYILALVFRSLFLGVAVTFSLLSASAFLQLHWLSWMVMLSGVVGAAHFISHRKMPVTIGAMPLVPAILICSLVVISAKSPVSFDMLDRLVAGTIHRDTLYHASIASMIKHYGVVSTGLNGLVETPYHFLSHGVIAALSVIAGTGVLESYGIIPLLLFIPLLLTSISYMAAHFGNPEKLYQYYILTGMCLALAPRILKAWGLKESYFGSESYIVGLLLMVLVLPILFRRHLRVRELALVLFAVAVLSIAKVSVGAIFLGLLFVRILWFTRGCSQLLKELSMFAIAVLILSVIIKPAIEMRSFYSDLQFWEYVRYYSLLGEWVGEAIYLAIVPVVMFVGLFYIFSWLTVKWRVDALGAGAVLHDRATVYLLAALAGGLLIVILPILPRSMSYYFSNIAMFIAMPWFIIALAEKDIKWGRGFYISMFVLLVLFKSTKFYDKTIFARDTNVLRHHVMFVDALLDLRAEYEPSVFLMPTDIKEANKYNPLDICQVAPFVYPAVTETAWVGVINTSVDCDYVHYGYGQYLDEDGVLADKPVLPAGFTIRAVELEHDNGERSR